MSTQQNQPAHDALKASVGSTPDCISLSRLDGPLTDTERDHLAHCARCQTELTLLEEFRASTPAAQNGAAVEWIAAEVQRRRRDMSVDDAAARGPGGFLGTLRWQPLGIAAAAVLAVAVGFVAWDREPQLRDPPAATEGYRTEQLSVISPKGDVAIPPDELRWVTVPGAERYDIAILEVDRTALWQGTSSVPRVGLPVSLTARFVPGKTVTWEVTARDRSGQILAVSGAQRFRVTKSP